MTSAPETSTTHELGQIKAVCLDVDDTLLNSERASRHGLRELVGSDRAWPVWQRTTDRHYARFVTNEIDFDAMCIERTQAFFAAFGEELDPAEAARRETLRMAAMQQAWGLYDDALPCLDWLRASGLQLAVITNAPSAYQRKKIGAVGLADTFDTLIISDEIGVAKPDERIFHTACDALGLDPKKSSTSETNSTPTRSAPPEPACTASGSTATKPERQRPTCRPSQASTSSRSSS